MTRPHDPSDRFRPRAAGSMAEMFDDVSPRYDLLNRVMSLGQDAGWRAALARSVPEDARVVMDLCTGSGASLDGLRRPGRTVLGVDVSLAMLRAAAERLGSSGWAPRFACGDAFRLPLRDRSLDAVTIAFGMRNLRPRREALAELARVLVPGGTLAVLEATAPRPGPFAGPHRLYLRHVIPWAGRISPDPSAYRYLSASILEFGTGEAFEEDLRAAGFHEVERRSFLLGAVRSWVAQSAISPGEFPAVRERTLHPARIPGTRWGVARGVEASATAEWRAWNGVQLALSLALAIGLSIAFIQLRNLDPSSYLGHLNRPAMQLLLAGAGIAFGVRSLVLAARLMGPRPDR